MNVACKFVLFSRLLSYSDRFTTWSLATWSEVLLKDPKFSRESHPGMPISYPVQYKRRSSWTESLGDICLATELVRLLPRGEVVRRQLQLKSDQPPKDDPTSVLLFATYLSLVSMRNSWPTVLNFVILFFFLALICLPLCAWGHSCTCVNLR